MVKSVHRLAWPLRLLFLMSLMPVMIVLFADFDFNPTWEIPLVLVVLSIPLVFAFFSASAITLKKLEGEVIVGFRPVYWKKIPISSLKSVELVEVDAFEFGGWGVKGSLKKKGLLLSAGGQWAILFENNFGKKVYVSVDKESAEVSELLDELNSPRSAEASPSAV